MLPAESEREDPVYDLDGLPFVPKKTIHAASVQVMFALLASFFVWACFTGSHVAVEPLFLKS